MLVTMADPATDGQGLVSEGSGATADKLYDLMPKVQNCRSNGDISVTDSEIKLEIDRSCGHPASVYRALRPNRYVEHVKYKGDSCSDESDGSECSWEEHDDGQGGTGTNYLCKHCSSCCNRFGAGCKKHQDPLVDKTHVLKHIDLNSTPKSSPYDNLVTPVSFLDLFCQRLEDDHDLDMDSIIIYVKNIIEQLKRISNGDYLTSEAREKWTGMAFPPNFRATEDNCDTKMLTSACMPLHLNKQCSGFPLSWKDLVRPDADVRSLSKIFERGIVIEVPKMLTGTYRMFRKSSGNNVTISYKQSNKAAEDNIARKFDLTFQIQPSGSKNFLTNNPVMMVEDSKAFPSDSATITGLVLPNKISQEDLHIEPMNVSISEYPQRNSTPTEASPKITEIIDSACITDLKEGVPDDWVEKVHSDTSRRSSNTTISLLDVLGKMSPGAVNSQQLSAFNPTSPDDLKVSIQSLNIQSCLQEESNEDCSVQNQEIPPKKRAPVSLKSPYDNQTYTIEDKRRRRLLEIRENREKRKKRMMHEKFPPKHSKCAKGHMAPTATSSVTKLSISNKSFYNSIFGQLGNMGSERNQKVRPNRKKEITDQNVINDTETHCVISTKVPAKYEAGPSNIINNGIILSEMEYRMKAAIHSKTQKDNTNVLKRVESSVVSSESSSSINLQMMAQFLIDNQKSHENSRKDNKDVEPHNMLHNTKSLHHLKSSTNRIWPSKMSVDSNCSKLSADDSRVLHVIEETDRVSEKKYPSRANLECRESIDKIYDLMRKIGKTDNNVNLKTTKTKFTTTNMERHKAMTKEGTAKDISVRESDSGMSIKQSKTSFGSSGSGEKHSKRHVKHKKHCHENNVNIPKVIISSKNPNIEKRPEPAITENKFSKDFKKNNPSFSKVSPRNPLSEISQVLQDKDFKKLNPSFFKVLPRNPLPEISKVLQDVKNLQKTRRKSPDPRNPKFISLSNSNAKKSSNKRTPQLEDVNDIEQDRAVIRNHFHKMQSQGNKKPYVAPIVAELHQTVDTPERRMPKKNSIELDDESKEARGEAVRGPTRQPATVSRLDTLAQPRKAYVQAHSEQFRSRYGRNLISDRLHRLAQAPSSKPAAGSQLSMRVQQNLRSKSDWSKEFVSNDSANADMRLHERRSGSNLVSKTTSSLVVEDIPTYKAFQSNNSDSIYESKVPSSMISEKNYVENEYGYISWRASVNSNHKTAGKNYIPLVPKHSERGDFKIANSSEESLTSVDVFGNAVLNSKTNEFFETINADDFAANGDNARIVKIKNGRVTLDSEDLIDKDISMFSETCNLVCSTKTTKYKEPEQEQQVDELISVNNITSDLKIMQMQEKCRISKLSFTSVHPSKSLFVLQAGDASTMVTLQGPSMHSLTDQFTHCPEPFSKIPNINNWIHWDVGSMPMQVSTVGYSFPIVCRQNFISDHNNCQQVSTINLAEVTNLENYTIPPTKTNEETSHKETNGQKDTSNSNGDVVNVQEEVESTGVVSNLDCTSSLDVLVNLLNEIRSISTRQTHIAKSFDCYMKQEDKPADTYTIKSTTENGTTCDIVTISSNEDIKKLEPYSGTYSLYVSEEHLRDAAEPSSIVEDKCVAVEWPPKDLVSQYTDTSSQHALMSCKGTSVTSLLNCGTSVSECTKSTIDLEKKCTDLLPFESVSSESRPKAVSYQIVSVYKRCSSEQFVLGRDGRQSEVTTTSVNTKVVPEKCEEDLVKIKRDVLLSVYAVLIFAVFAAMSYPDILLLRS